MNSASFYTSAITGLIFIIVGFIFFKFPPKKINGIYGYRTPAAMKNQATWNFAQRFSAKEMMKLGSLLTLTSAAGLAFKTHHNAEGFAGPGLIIITVIILLVRVESAIKEFEDRR